MYLTEQHQTFRKKIRDFLLKELAPKASQIEENEPLARELINKLATQGLLGVPIPKEYGGLGLDTISYAITVEEISRVCGSTGLTVAAHTSLGTYPIYLFGTEEQKRKYLPPLARGEVLGSLGLTEPNAGSDAGGIETTAVLDGDEYIINGSKCFITNGSISSTLVVAAVTSPPSEESKGRKGISNFIVERGMAGFSSGKKEDKLGVRGTNTAELIFDNLRVPRENLLGKENEGFKQTMITLDGGRISIGAMALGIAQAALDVSLQHAKQRKQFQKPIGGFQAIQWKLADMATQIEAARQLLYYAAYCKDQGKRFTKEAAMAKLFASEIGREATYNAIQIFGARGYLREYPVERLFRDIKLTEIGEGTSEIQRIVIAHQLLKD